MFVNTNKQVIDLLTLSFTFALWKGQELLAESDLQENCT